MLQQLSNLNASLKIKTIEVLVHAFCLLLTVCSDVWEYSLIFFVFVSCFRIVFVFLFWHWHSELYFATHVIHSVIKSYEYYRKIILILKFHVRQSQYVLQIVQCKNLRFCKSWRTNYSEFFPTRFLPSLIPLVYVEEGLEISILGHHFGSLFQSLHLASVKVLQDIRYEKFCPSSKNQNKQGKTLLVKRRCAKCLLYHYTIKTVKKHAHQCNPANHEAEEFFDEEWEED